MSPKALKYQYISITEMIICSIDTPVPASIEPPQRRCCRYITHSTGVLLYLYFNTNLKFHASNGVLALCCIKHQTFLKVSYGS